MFEDFARLVAGLSPAQFTALMLASSLCAAVGLLAGFRAVARKRLAEDTPTTLLRSAAQGYVELSGIARLFEGERIHAPLTGRECCWYDFEVAHREQDRNARSRWRTVSRGTSDEIFMLDDGTGICAVDPDRAEVTPSVTNVWHGNSPVPPRLTARDGWPRVPVSAGSYRYTERLIEIGRPIYALGFLRTHGGAAAPAEHSADIGALLREWKADRAALLRRYDRDGDGAIDPAEWEQARSDAAAQVRAARADRAAAPPAVDVLAKPPAGGLPFVLAAGAETQLTRRHAWASFGWLAVGICAALLAGSGLAVRLGGG